MSQAHKEWQDGHDAAVRRIHLLEAQLVIWRQIEESKSELLQWLSETSGGLTVCWQKYNSNKNFQAEFVNVQLSSKSPLMFCC